MSDVYESELNPDDEPGERLREGLNGADADYDDPKIDDDVEDEDLADKYVVKNDVGVGDIDINAGRGSVVP